MQDKKQQLKFAIEYLDYCIHEGMADVDDLKGMTDDEIIEMATDYQDRGDAAYDAWKERFA